MAIYRGPGGPGDATTDATNEATVATTKAAEASASASSAASSASTASTKASEASTSATNSASSASSASTSAASASSSATASANSATSALSSQNAALNAQTAAETAETNASSSETAAASSASSASTSATNAATSETNAANSATAAATSATNSANSATASANSASEAAAYVDTFDDKYLGAKTTAPTVDNDGDPLTDGALYFNTTSNIMYVYDLGTTSWLQLTLTAANQTNVNTVATNINDVTTVATNVSDVVTFATTYLGAYASPPTTSQVGALYWNTGVNSLYIWDGSSWNAAAFTASGSVTSFNTRTGAVTLSSADVTTALGYTPSTVANLNDITDVTITTPSTNQVLKYNGSVWVNDSDTDTGIQYTDLSVSTAAAGSPALAYNNTNGVFTYTPPDLSSFITASSTDTLTNKSGNISQWTNDSGYLTTETYTGTVTSVAATVPTGFTVTGSPITTNGTLAVAFDTGYSLPTTANQTNWDTAYGWGDHSTVGYLTSYTETDPVVGAITGIVKSDGAGNISSAISGTDYLGTSDIGVSVQAYDVDTLKADVADTLTAPFRGTVTTDNDLSFDQNVTNNFSCTPSSGGTLTFTNHTAGQSGYVLLDNSSGYAITAAATTKITATDLTTISTAGVYLISYFDNGTNAYLTVSASYS